MSGESEVIAVSQETRCVLCAVLEFDDGTSNISELHRGTFESCKKVGDRIPALFNSTGKKVVNSFLCTPLESEYDEATSKESEVIVMIKG